MDCFESILEGIVRVDIVESGSSFIPVPPTVGGITELACVFEPFISLANGNVVPMAEQYPPAEVVVMSEDGATLRTSRKGDGAAQFTHELQATLIDNIKYVLEAEGRLYKKDFCCVVYTDKGERYLAYSLPHASGLSIEENRGNDYSATLKISIISKNRLISIF